MMKLHTVTVCGMLVLVGTPHKSVAANTDASNVDTQIASYLTKIEETLVSDDKASFVELSQMLITADNLLPRASVEGRQLVQDFPERLRSRAKQATRMHAVNLKIFADAASPYLNGTPIGKNSEPAPEIIPTAAAATIVTATVPSIITAPNPETIPTPSAPSILQQNLLNRGDAMLDLGDISAARLLYQHVAYSGIGIAALRLADTYDPAFLAAHHVIGIQPDRTKAEQWYRKAASLGASQAEQRLKSFLANE